MSKLERRQESNHFCQMIWSPMWWVEKTEVLQTLAKNQPVRTKEWILLHCGTQNQPSKISWMSEH
jgi:hypothetical protein